MTFLSNNPKWEGKKNTEGKKKKKGGGGEQTKKKKNQSIHNAVRIKNSKSNVAMF